MLFLLFDGASSDGIRIAPNGQDSSHNRQLIHSAGDILTCHFDKRDIQFNNTPYGPGGQPRRIQVAWQGGRRGLLSTPTELTLRNTPLGLRVCKQPVEEIAKLRTRTVTRDGSRLAPGDTNPLAESKGGLYDIELEADLSQAERLALTIRGVRLDVYLELRPRIK